MDKVIFFKCVYVDYLNCSDYGMKIMNNLIVGFYFF